MSTVPCPDNGKCGRKNHLPNSDNYKRCLYKASARARHRGKDRLAQVVPSFTNDAQNQSLAEYRQLIETMQERKVYSAAESFVNKNMVIQEDMVQAYINNPDEINELCREELGELYS